MKTYASGILPVTWINGVALFLVGEDVRDSSFSDFGGKMERYDRNIIATACREFYEETLGCIIDIKQMRARINPQTALMVRGRTQNQNSYFMYITEIPYIPHLRSTFHKLLGFFRAKNIQRMYVEKTDIQWVTLDMLKSMNKRSVFANTINMHMSTIEKIGTSSPSQWKNICKEHAASFE
jgi:hypothetical protein